MLQVTANSSLAKHLSSISLPGGVSASERYWEQDIIEPPVTVSRQSTIKSPTTPGIGYEVDEARIEALTTRRETVRL